MLHIRAFLAKRNKRSIENSLHIRCVFFYLRVCFQEGMSSLTHIWEKVRRQVILFDQRIEEEMQKNSPKESMTDFDKIKNSAFEWMNIIEMKKFVDDGSFLRMKTTLTIWQYKNPSTIRTNGSFIPTSKILIPSHWEIVLISSKHCLLCNGYNKKQRKTQTPTYSHKHKQWQLTQSSFSTWWNWREFWWSSHNSESDRGNESCFAERKNPLPIILWRKLPKMDFKNSIYFVTNGSFEVNVGLLYYPTGEIKTTLRMTHFAMWKWRSQNTIWLLMHNWTVKSQRRNTIHLTSRVRSETERQDARLQWRTTRPPRNRAPSTQRTWTSTRELVHAVYHERIVQ